MQEHLPTFLSAIVGDVFDIEHWPMANLSGAGLAIAVGQLLRSRSERGRDILLEEVRHGEKSLGPADLDHAVAALLRYVRASREGAARLNLRLMAKVIADQAYQGDLYADKFLRYADVLAGLRREEVILLGALQRHWSNSDLLRVPEQDRMSEARRRISTELVPMPFPDEVELAAAESAILRTGFVASSSVFGGVVYQPTRSFMRLCSFVSFDATLRAEPA